MVPWCSPKLEGPTQTSTNSRFIYLTSSLISHQYFSQGTSKSTCPKWNPRSYSQTQSLSRVPVVENETLSIQDITQKLLSYLFLTLCLKPQWLPTAFKMKKSFKMIYRALGGCLIQFQPNPVSCPHLPCSLCSTTLIPFRLCKHPTLPTIGPLRKLSLCINTFTFLLLNPITFFLFQFSCLSLGHLS